MASNNQRPFVRAQPRDDERLRSSGTPRPSSRLPFNPPEIPALFPVALTVYSTLVSVALFSALAIQGALADFNVVTPSSIVQCDAVQFTWDAVDGTKTYNVALVFPDYPCDTALADLGDHTMNHITWNVTLPVGTKVDISVMASSSTSSDSDDYFADGWSGSFEVKAGNSTARLPASLQFSSAASTAASSSAKASAPAGTTLIVNPEAAATTSAPAAPTSSSGAEAIGAAKSGILGNGAFSLQLSGSTLVLSAVFAVAALAF